MNRKTRGNLFFVAALFLAGCTTMRPTAPPVPGAAEYRETQAEIQRQQAELAITGTKIGEDSRDIVEGITAIESTLAVPDYDREKLVNQVRELRVIAEKHQADTETLNRQLASERETTRRQGELFDKREEAWQTALSGREAENAALVAENKAVKGQGRTRLIIIIALGGAWAVYLGYRVCRFLKIIPR
jgi:hypothetical protein